MFFRAIPSVSLFSFSFSVSLFQELEFTALGKKAYMFKGSAVNQSKPDLVAKTFLQVLAY